jgi:hypothetical protein
LDADDPDIEDPRDRPYIDQVIQCAIVFIESGEGERQEHLASVCVGRLGGMKFFTVKLLGDELKALSSGERK